MTLEQFNHLPKEIAKEELFKCCGSNAWAEKLSANGPFTTITDLKNESDKIWDGCSRNDWLEAFSHHPKIGDLKSLQEKFASTKHLASNEQSGIISASQEVLIELKEYNDWYEKKFGFIFIVCATGKSAAEMIAFIKQRFNNTEEKEIEIAMEEQNKITHLRLDKLFS